MLTDYITGFERHLRILQALSEKSVRAYSRKVRDFCDWIASGERPTDPSLITREDIEAYLEDLFYRRNSNPTRLTKLIAIRKFFRYLAYERIITDDVTARIPLPKIRRKFVQRFTREEILRIFSVIPMTTDKGLRDAVVIILAAFCGLRVGEIIGLTLHDIIEEGKSLDIQVTGKFDKPRRLYLWKVPSEILRSWLSLRINQGARAGDPLIISYRRGRNGSCAKGNPMTTTALDDMVKQYAAAAAIRKPRISMHMFRASHASDLRHIQGYDTPAIAERLGHASIATTDRYIPTRGRIHHTYPSLSVYWKEFARIWENRGNVSKIIPCNTANTDTRGADDAEK
jgi:integrase/recombinase XerD